MADAKLDLIKHSANVTGLSDEGLMTAYSLPLPQAISISVRFVQGQTETCDALGLQNGNGGDVIPSLDIVAVHITQTSNAPPCPGGA